MSFRRFFTEEMSRRYPEDTALPGDVERRYTALYPEVEFSRRSTNPMDRRLDFCAYFLAAIQCLEQRGESFEGIREFCLAVTHAFVTPQSAWGRWRKRLPAKLMATPLMSIAATILRNKMGKKGHADGFLVQIITDPASTNGLGYGFDIVECGVCKLFDKFGATKYAAVLCEVDELTSALAGLELIRSGTIARGAPKCDFRFKRR